MVIDVDAKAKSLGITFEDFRLSEDYMRAEMFKLHGNETDEQYIDLLKSLPKNQLVAQIRWKNLHKGYPDVFDWNGLKDNAK